MLGTGNKAHAVRLFPAESCTCPSTTHCYHILAAKLSIGLEGKQQQKMVNLTQLRRNTRQKRNKKSGRKKPRAGDYDIIKAPDAVSILNALPIIDLYLYFAGKPRNPKIPNRFTT